MRTQRPAPVPSHVIDGLAGARGAPPPDEACDAGWTCARLPGLEIPTVTLRGSGAVPASAGGGPELQTASVSPGALRASGIVDHP